MSHRVVDTHTLQCADLRSAHHFSQTWSSPNSIAVTSFDIEHSFLHSTVVLKNVSNRVADTHTLRCAVLRRTHHSSQKWPSPSCDKVTSFDMENFKLQTDSIPFATAYASYKKHCHRFWRSLLWGFSQRHPIHALGYGSCFHGPPILPNSSCQISCHANPWKRQLFPWICDPTKQLMPDKM